MLSNKQWFGGQKLRIQILLKKKLSNKISFYNYNIYLVGNKDVLLNL